jgi:hypothetical protein
MKILRAIGIGVFLLIFASMMPMVFAGFERMLIALFASLENIFTAASMVSIQPPSL